MTFLEQMQAPQKEKQLRSQSNVSLTNTPYYGPKKKKTQKKKKYTEDSYKCI